MSRSLRNRDQEGEYHFMEKIIVNTLVIRDRLDWQISENAVNYERKNEK